jgi:hypothetical protein
MSILQDHAQKFREFRGDDGKIIKSLKGAVAILCSLSTSAAGIGLVCPTLFISFFYFLMRAI